MSAAFAIVPRHAPGPDVLTPAQTRIVDLLARGYSTRQTAARLGIAINTVRMQINLVYGKLDFTHRAELLLWALQQGFGSSHTLEIPAMHATN